MSSLLDTAKQPKECDYFLTILIKILVILAFFRKNVLLTAKIKNTMLLALESVESLYQEFGH